MKRIAISLILLFLLVGCIETFQQTDSGIVPTVATTLTPSPSPTINAWDWNNFTNLTPIPTLSVLQQADLIELLSSNSCNLPCYLGIEPGKTTFDVAENIITELGGVLRADYKNFYEGYPEKSPLRLSSYIFDVNSLFYIDLAISGKNDQVQQIVFNILSNFQPLFYDTWQKYSIESIFKDYGEPDQIFIYKNTSYNVRSYTIRATYFQYGMILDWSGTLIDNSSEYKICPEFSKENIHNLQIILDESESTFEDISSSYMGLEEMWVSTDKTLGISEKEFYESIILNPDTCFEMKNK